MPFQSEAQRRLFWAKVNEGEISKAKALEWEHETPNRKLPMHKNKKTAMDKIAAVKEARRMDPNALKAHLNTLRASSAAKRVSAAPAAAASVKPSFDPVAIQKQRYLARSGGGPMSAMTTTASAKIAAVIELQRRK